MPAWVQNLQPQSLPYTHQMYGAYNAFSGGYPNASASSSPMNYGPYYSSGPGYGAASDYFRGYSAANSYTPTGNSSYNQQATPGAINNQSGRNDQSGGDSESGGNSESDGNSESGGNGFQGQGNASKDGNDAALAGTMVGLSLDSK